ncbi:hypothetical protein [[Phormidium] sp. ETS-05]|uniref:hypothetical protein n=1 Tax=[Phormidium] sp. ETS-05 TaxID=222819 RepID=UPI0018EF199F|nr:hypothetical protein [[Phormidium] sp. ETS-05]
MSFVLCPLPDRAGEGRSPERSTVVGLKFEDFTTAVLPLLRCSVVMLGEPG